MASITVCKNYAVHGRWVVFAYAHMKDKKEPKLCPSCQKAAQKGKGITPLKDQGKRR